MPPPDDPGGLLEPKKEDGTARAYEASLVRFLYNQPDSVYAPYAHWIVAALAAKPVWAQGGADAPEAEAINLRLREHYRAVAEGGLPALAEEAWYRVGSAECGLGHLEEGIAILERVVQQFPDSRWAAEARESLPNLRQIARLVREKEGR